MAIFPEVKLAGKILGDMASLMMFVAPSSSLQESRLTFERVFIFLVVIMVRKPDGGILSKTIIKTFEEISFAENIGVVGNHNSYFAE